VRLSHDWALARELIAGKARERLVPLAQQFLGKAVFENNREIATTIDREEVIAAE
jgi:hypothetical protein